MQKIQLPHVILPKEFVSLLKTNLSVVSSASQVFDLIRPNQAIYMVLEKAFQEFDDGRGVEKTMMALGWSNFRDRMASVYIHKAIFGNYPLKTNMELVEEIKDFENRFTENSVQSFSRVFLLGFYLKLANIQIQRRENNQYLELKIPEELGPILKISQARSERIDWLILITLHLMNGLGDKLLINGLAAGKNFNDLYALLSPENRKLMLDNLLAYGTSIHEPDFFLYEKI